MKTEAEFIEAFGGLNRIADVRQRVFNGELLLRDDRAIIVQFKQDATAYKWGSFEDAMTRLFDCTGVQLYRVLLRHTQPVPDPASYAGVQMIDAVWSPAMGWRDSKTGQPLPSAGT